MMPEPTTVSTSIKVPNISAQSFCGIEQVLFEVNSYGLGTLTGFAFWVDVL